jgi:hypothetical protein
LDAGAAVPDSSSPAIVEENGHVEFEAEQFTAKASGSGEASDADWLSVSDSGVSGGTAMEVVPNDGVNVGDSTDGARLDYDVEFNNTGTYYVWVRMRGPTEDDDSLHAGLDGSPASYGGGGMTDLSGDWVWENRVGWNADGDRVTVDVNSTGTHTVNIWMREDGTQADEIVLTTDPDFTPDQNSADFVETGGEVTMQAEDFTAKALGSGDASSSEWLSFSDTNAANGTAMKVVPNDGVNVSDSTDGARLDYDVEFNTTGTYYIWVRMRGPSGTDDSVHAGLDGNPASYGGGGITDNSGDWVWQNRVGWSADGDRVTVDVNSTGIHTVNVWMREDGTQVDEILLTTDETKTP